MFVQKLPRFVTLHPSKENTETKTKEKSESVPYFLCGILNDNWLVFIQGFPKVEVINFSMSCNRQILFVFYVM